jgi:hypothetical protein
MLPESARSDFGAPARRAISPKIQTNCLIHFSFVRGDRLIIAALIETKAGATRCPDAERLRLSGAFGERTGVLRM